MIGRTLEVSVFRAHINLLSGWESQLLLAGWYKLIKTQTRFEQNDAFKMQITLASFLSTFNFCSSLSLSGNLIGKLGDRFELVHRKLRSILARIIRATSRTNTDSMELPSWKWKIFFDKSANSLVLAKIKSSLSKSSRMKMFHRKVAAIRN